MNELEISETCEIIFNSPKVPAKWHAIDRLEKLMITQERWYGEVTERGTPGLYTREIVMPTGMLCTSRIHKTCHQYIVSQGAVTVYNTFDDSTQLIEARHHGITFPGTRRVLFVHSECCWTTSHPTDKIKIGFELLEKQEQQAIFDSIMKDLIQDYDNPLTTDFTEGVLI